MVQWLGLCASTAGGMGLIPGLVGELRSYKPCDVAPPKKKTQQFKDSYLQSIVMDNY